MARLCSATLVTPRAGTPRGHCRRSRTRASRRRDPGRSTSRFPEFLSTVGACRSMWTRPSDLSEQPETGATCAIGIRSSDQAGIWVPALTKEPAPRASRLTRWGKKLNGRKRHILVDTQGNLMLVIVHPANISDRDGADWVLEEA